MTAVRRLAGAPDPELESFFWNSADLMAVLDRELGVIKQNPVATQTLGADQCGRSILDRCVPGDRARAEAALRSCLEGRVETFEAELTLSGQRVRTFEWAVCCAANAQHLFVTLRDVTSRRVLERELANAQKLEVVGQLASGIAHEINTPIQFIGDNLSFIGDSLSDVFSFFNALIAHPPSQALLDEHPNLDIAFLATELPSSVEQAAEGVQRVAELVRSMKEFAHHDRGEVVPTDLNRAIERTLVVCKSEWKHVAKLETDFGVLPMVPCQASAMRQVFLNVICNAAQANAERNKLTGRGMGLIRITTRASAEQVTVAISDTGGGMPDAIKARLFEPFFTTKAVGRGTGQGLTLSRSIVCDQHRGELSFDTEVGVGTTFSITLPLRASAHAP